MHGSGIDKDVHTNGLTGEVTSWDVAYYINDEESPILDETAVFTIDQLYPGMPDREDVVHIYNMGTTSSTIKYELISVKVFGEDITEQLKTDNIIQTDGNTTNLFSDDTKYPFNISYTYDKTRLDGRYVDDETTPDAVATFKFNVNWPFTGNGTEAEKLAKDVLDTQFGKDAYKYYQNSENNPAKAVEIKVKITSAILRENQ